MRSFELSIFAIFLHLFLWSNSIRASIVYTDIPDVAIGPGGSSDFDIDADAIDDVRIFQTGNSMRAIALGQAALDVYFNRFKEYIFF